MQMFTLGCRCALEPAVFETPSDNPSSSYQYVRKLGYRTPFVTLALLQTDWECRQDACLVGG